MSYWKMKCFLWDWFCLRLPSSNLCRVSITSSTANSTRKFCLTWWRNFEAFIRAMVSFAIWCRECWKQISKEEAISVSCMWIYPIGTQSADCWAPKVDRINNNWVESVRTFKANSETAHSKFLSLVSDGHLWSIESMTWRVNWWAVSKKRLNMKYRKDRDNKDQLWGTRVRNTNREFTRINTLYKINLILLREVRT